MVGIVGAIVVAFGIVILVVGLLKPRKVAVRCDGASCFVEKIAVLGKTSIEVKNVRGATAEEKRRGARDNVRLVIHGDTDVEMGSWVSRGDSNAYAYRNIAAKIDAHVAAGSKGTLEESVGLSRTIVLWLLAITLIGIGGVIVSIYLTGSKMMVDGPRGQYFHGKGRGPLSDIASIEIRGPSIFAKKKSGGEVRLIHTISRKGKAIPELATAAERIRAYLG